MGSGKSAPPLSQSPSQLQGLQFQTSTPGGVVPVVFGITRIPGNLIWYGDFQSHTQSSGGGGKSGGKGGGGKGGGGGGGTTTYSASFEMAICEGPIEGVLDIYAGSTNYGALEAVGLTLLPGTYPQDPSPLDGLNYPGTAYVWVSNANLGTSPNLPNLSFLVIGLCPKITADTESTIVGDVTIYRGNANPADVIMTIITDPKIGLNLPLAMLEVGDFFDYCMAAGLLLSPAYTSQKPAFQCIQDLCDATNSVGVWHNGSVLKIVPYTLDTMIGNGYTWEPDLTPQYDLTDDDFICDNTNDPVKVTRQTPADFYNSILVEYLDQNNQYNVATVQLQDQAFIDLYGRHDAGTKSYHMATNTDTAKMIGTLLMRRNLYFPNIYEFKLSWKYCRLEPMDIVSLTDSRLGMDHTLVRIISVNEDKDGLLDIQAEDCYGIGAEIPVPFCLKLVGETPALPSSPQVTPDHKIAYRNGKIYGVANGLSAGDAHGYIVDAKTMAILSTVDYDSAVDYFSSSSLTWSTELGKFLIIGLRGDLAYIYELDENLTITDKVFFGSTATGTDSQVYGRKASSQDFAWNPALMLPTSGSSWSDWMALIDSDARANPYSASIGHNSWGGWGDNPSVTYYDGKYVVCRCNGDYFAWSYIVDRDSLAPTNGFDQGLHFGVLSGGKVYAVDSGLGLSELDPAAATGSDPVVRTMPLVANLGRPYVYGGKIYLAYQTGTYIWTISKIDIASFTIEASWSNTFDGIHVPPDMPQDSVMGADGRLYVSCEGGIVVLNPTNMSFICFYPDHGSEGIISDGTMYLYGTEKDSGKVQKYFPGDMDNVFLGYTPNANASPGSVSTPVIFTAPGILTQSGYEVWMAVSGPDPNWGGCDVYGSTDGTTYAYIGTIRGRSRFGTVSVALPSHSDPDAVDTLSVDLSISQGSLLSVTQADADNGLTLCLVENELISFETATLILSYQYGLTYLRRGFYNSPIASHATAGRFVSLDNKIFKYLFGSNLIGSTVYFKFASFNLYGGGKQTLDVVTAYPFTIGSSLSFPSNVAGFAASEVGGLVNFSWTAITDPNLAGYEIRRNASGVTTWAGATVVVTGQGGNSFLASIPTGAYTFLICAQDKSGNYSQTPGRYDLTLT